MTRSFEIARMPYQDTGSVDEATIAAWEKRHRVRLPEDYRRFILLTNGGALRPYTFEVQDQRIHGRLHPLKCLYDWREVLDESQESVPDHLRNTPPDSLAIGITSTELLTMLSLASLHFGAIAVWPKDLFNPWGDGMNTFVVPVARSFSSFLDLLGAHGDVYLSYWSMHDSKGWTANRITL